MNPLRQNQILFNQIPRIPKYTINTILNWNTVTTEIQPLAKKYLKQTKETLQNKNYKVSTIHHSSQNGIVRWDFTTTSPNNKTIVISLEIVDSLEFEDEMLGYNIALKAITEDGNVFVQHAPHNYTEKVWTTTLKELKNRTRTLPTITPHEL